MKRHLNLSFPKIIHRNLQQRVYDSKTLIVSKMELPGSFCLTGQFVRAICRALRSFRETSWGWGRKTSCAVVEQWNFSFLTINGKFDGLLDVFLIR